MNHEVFEDENYEPSWAQIVSESPEILEQDAEEMEKIDNILAQLPPMEPLLLEKTRRAIDTGAEDHFVFRMSESEQARLRAAEERTKMPDSYEDCEAFDETAHDIAERIAERQGIDLLEYDYWRCDRLDDEHLIAFRFSG